MKPIILPLLLLVSVSSFAQKSGNNDIVVAPSAINQDKNPFGGPAPGYKRLVTFAIKAKEEEKNGVYIEVFQVPLTQVGDLANSKKNIKKVFEGKTEKNGFAWFDLKIADIDTSTANESVYLVRATKGKLSNRTKEGFWTQINGQPDGVHKGIDKDGLILDDVDGNGILNDNDKQPYGCRFGTSKKRRGLNWITIQ